MKCLFHFGSVRQDLGAQSDLRMMMTSSGLPENLRFVGYGLVEQLVMVSCCMGSLIQQAVIEAGHCLGYATVLEVQAKAQCD